MKKTLIMLSGGMSSGKDTFASYVKANYVFSQTAFADHMKESLFLLVKPLVPELTIFHFYDPSLKNEPLSLRSDLSKKFYTPRDLMQWYGEVVKENFGIYYWCKIVENKIKDTSDNIIITDARFIYEIEYFKNSSYINHNYSVNTILINRENVNPSSSNSSHISENHFKNYKNFDFVVQNESTLDNFYKKIKDIMEKIK